jgi:hypothetical protein
MLTAGTSLPPSAGQPPGSSPSVTRTASSWPPRPTVTVTVSPGSLAASTWASVAASGSTVPGDVTDPGAVTTRPVAEMMPSVTLLDRPSRSARPARRHRPGPCRSRRTRQAAGPIGHRPGSPPGRPPGSCRPAVPGAAALCNRCAAVMKTMWRQAPGRRGCARPGVSIWTPYAAHGFCSASGCY